MELHSFSTPTIFRPIHLRNGDKFRALQRYSFNAEEKLWVCNYIVSSCDDIETKIDGDVALFCKRYQLSPTIVRSWINQYADGISFNERVCPLDSIGINVIRELVAIGAQSGESYSNYQNRLYDCMLTERNRSYLSKGYS